MANGAGVIIWFRRDLRLDDHPALVAACADAKATGSAVLPVFIHDQTVETLGAAARWRLGLSVAALAKELEQATADIERRTARLGNPGFADKAPAAVVQRERDGLAAAHATAEKLRERIQQLGDA